MNLLARVGGFLALAFPMIVSRGGLAGTGIADGLMVARHSAGELAILGLVDGTMGRVVDVLAAFLGSGLVLAASAQAAGRSREAGAAWRHATLLALTLGSIVAALGVAGWWLFTGIAGGWGLATSAFPVVVAIAITTPASLVALCRACSSRRWGGRSAWRWPSSPPISAISG